MKTFSWARTLLVVGLLIAGCDDDDDGDRSSDFCRRYPLECEGEPGALCGVDRDCGPDLFCCTQRENCGGGMCTQRCADDRDCPLDMLCEHDMCFYACATDRDCADGMRCEHGNTICEYP